MSSSARCGGRRWWLLAVAGGVALGLAGGLVIGGPTRPATVGPGPVGGAGSGPCPAARSADGATRAAVCYVTLLYRLEGQPDAVVREQLRAVAVAGAQQRLARLVGGGVPVGGRAAAGVLTVRLDSYGEQSAQVFVWAAVARSAKPGSPDSDAVVAAVWFTEAVVVDWAGDRWMLGEVGRSATPPPAGSTNLAADWRPPSYAER